VNKFSCTERSELKLPFKILVGTHHKTGTVWLDSIFRAICQNYSLEFYSGTQRELPSKFDVFFQDHSEFSLHCLHSQLRGVHIIRDPRDVIISGCFYHQTSKEAWLHQPKKSLQGLSYHEKINSYKNIDDKILFEMENAGYRTIMDMLCWNYTLPCFFELKYEHLIGDLDLILFREAFSFLGFPCTEIPNIVNIASTNSIFSSQFAKSEHVRSGEVRQWKKYFKPIHKKRLLEIFDDALIQLEYEKDESWVTPNFV
jgi:hypothetical protein